MTRSLIGAMDATQSGSSPAASPAAAHLAPKGHSRSGSKTHRRRLTCQPMSDWKQTCCSELQSQPSHGQQSLAEPQVAPDRPQQDPFWHSCLSGQPPQVPEPSQRPHGTLPQGVSTALGW